MLSTIIKNYLGIDKALFFSLLSRGWQLIAGIITFSVILHFMQPAEQGFYYTFYSIINLQIFFELGLTFVILQLTSHYFLNLRWRKHGFVQGEDSQRQKFFTLLKVATYWYGIAALIFMLFLIPIGLFFFATHKHMIHFNWQLPWILLVIGTAINLAIAPLLAAIEGSGRVSEFYHFKTWQLLFGNLFGWTVVILGGGLFMAATTVWTIMFISLYWIFFRNRYFVLQIMKTKIEKHIFSWSHEVWPMQWRIALSWMSGYFIGQIFTPLIFYYHGAIAAGKIGISVTLCSMLGVICITWVNVRSPLMGRLIAAKNWMGLNQLFSRIFWQSIAVFFVGSITILITLLTLSHFAWGERFLPLPLILLLLIANLCNHITAAFALYLRAHKKDPFMPLSLIGALLIASGSWYGAAKFGSTGVCWALALVNALYGLPSGLILWMKLKQKWHRSPI